MHSRVFHSHPCVWFVSIVPCVSVRQSNKNLDQSNRENLLDSWNEDNNKSKNDAINAPSCKNGFPDNSFCPLDLCVWQWKPSFSRVSESGYSRIGFVQDLSTSSSHYGSTLPQRIIRYENRGKRIYEKCILYGCEKLTPLDDNKKSSTQFVAIIHIKLLLCRGMLLMVIFIHTFVISITAHICHRYLNQVVDCPSVMKFSFWNFFLFLAVITQSGPVLSSQISSIFSIFVGLKIDFTITLRLIMVFTIYSFDRNREKKSSTKWSAQHIQFHLYIVDNVVSILSYTSAIPIDVYGILIRNSR